MTNPKLLILDEATEGLAPLIRQKIWQCLHRLKSDGQSILEHSVMAIMSANNAKARFGELLDTAQREPVTIEKHGRPVAVMLSTCDYNDLEALKLARLRDEVDIGLAALQRGDVVEVSASGIQQLANDIKSAGRKNAGQ